MFIGHYSASFLAKRLRPDIPLWGLFLAAQLVDVAWGILILVGVEHGSVVDGARGFAALNLYHMPYTHELVPFTLLWMLVAAAATRAGPRTRHVTNAALAVALVVGSHWVFDLVVHPRDLATYPAGPKVGLNLWATPFYAFLLEAVLFWLCLRVYMDVAKTRGVTERRAEIFGLVMTALLAGFSFGPAFGIKIVAIVGLVFYGVTIYWASKIDMKRSAAFPV